MLFPFDLADYGPEIEGLLLDMTMEKSVPVVFVRQNKLGSYDSTMQVGGDRMFSGAGGIFKRVNLCVGLAPS